MSQNFVTDSGDVLLVVDLQRDFCAGGALAVPDADAIVPIVNRIASRFANVVLVQDWHPRGHSSFASSHPGHKAFETITLPSGAQTLWPDHCVQDSEGAKFHADLHIPHATLVIRKGFHPSIDSYSAFRENDRETRTGLAGYLRERGLGRVFIAGLAYDFCVRFSAEDARAAGFSVVVIEDACRGLDIDGSMAATRAELEKLGCAQIGHAAV